MSVIKIFHEVTIAGLTVTGNNLVGTTLADITKLSYCVQNTTVAISSTSQLMWTTLNAGVTTFTQGLLITDQDLYIELRTDNGTPEYVLLWVKANTPFWFSGRVGGNTTESLDGAILVDGTDYDDVDRIEVQNDGTTAATISLYLFT
jgi:hypothetical protein